MADFFHYPQHLEYLIQTALPELIRSHGYGVRRRLVVWSMECSEGEEAYTLAMVLREFSDRYPGLGFDFLILATDASPGALEAAARAVYPEGSIARVPNALRQKYLLKSKDVRKRLVKIDNELKAYVKFRNIDFVNGRIQLRESMDIIFCRGILHRLPEKVQNRLIQELFSHLSPGGYLFLDHPGPLGRMDIPLMPMASEIYRKLS